MTDGFYVDPYGHKIQQQQEPDGSYTFTVPPGVPWIRWVPCPDDTDTDSWLDDLAAASLSAWKAKAANSLIVRDEDWPHGLRCGDCACILNDGDHYAERWTGMAGEVPAVKIVCVACGNREQPP